MLVRSLIVAGILAWAPAASAELVMVKVVGENVTVKSRPSRTADVLAVTQPDAVLEVLSKEGGWFWVLLDRDSHGTQRAGWIRESEVAFLNDGGRHFPPSAPMPLVDESKDEAAEPAASPDTAVAEAEVEEPRPVKVAQAEKPRKVDDRKLRRAEQELEKARQAYEKLVPRAASPEPEPFAMVGEPIVEPLFQH